MEIIMSGTKINRGAAEKARNEHLAELWDDRLSEELECQKTKNTYFAKININEFDEQTNEVSSISSKIPTEPNFIKLYLNDIVVLKGIQPAYKDVLYHLLKLVKYEDYIITLTKFDKLRIAKACGMSGEKPDQQVSNAIGKLKKAGILFAIVDKNGKIERGAFEINPYLFGKGNWAVNYNQREVNKLMVLYRNDVKELINVDAIIEYIKSEKDTEKKQAAVNKLNEIRGINQ